MRALIVEDDPILRNQVSQCFINEGFAVDTADNGDAGLIMAKTCPIDVAIIDLGLPGLSGVDIVRKTRRAGCTFPILILTARDGWQSKVEGLEAGADDYLVKPFQKEELMARARALLRRVSGWSQRKLDCGPVVVDRTSRTVAVLGQAVALTAYEFKVLECFILNAGKVLSKSTLSDHLYAEEHDRNSNVIEVFVRRLRGKLDPESTLHPITTLRGSGYRWDLAGGPTNVPLRPMQ